MASSYWPPIVRRSFEFREKTFSPTIANMLLSWPLLILFSLLAACGGGGGGGNAGGGGGASGGSATLTSIAITPPNPTVQAGGSRNLVATGGYSDGATRDITGSVTWTSSSIQVATITAGGVVNAIAAGSTTITATVGGITATTSVTVTASGGTSQATVTYLHEFRGVPDGNQPNGPLLQASDGNFYGTTRAGGANRCRGFSNIPCGTIFRVTPSGQETVLYIFGASPTDAFTPNAGLIQGSDGALYGTTSSGGVYGAGAVFRITLGGSYTVLYSFGATPTDGSAPVAALLQANDGNFYGTTASGGANHCVQIPQSGGNCGTVFRMTPSGAVTILYSFGTSAADGVTPLGSLVQGADGNFYGTTVNGGANSCSTSGETNNCGTVFRITPSGNLTILHSFGTSLADGIAPQGPLTVGSDGAFYGTTPSGGGGICGFAFGCGTVFRVTAAGSLTILYRFAVTGGRTDGDGPSPFLTLGRDGNFYGTTRSGGATPAASNGTAFRLTPSGSKTILFSFGPLLTNPADPLGGMIQGSDGAFYGVTAGTVFKLVP